MVCTGQLHLNQPTSKLIVNHNFAMPLLTCVAMVTCDKMMEVVGSNPESYTEYGKNSCDINHRSYWTSEMPSHIACIFAELFVVNNFIFMCTYKLEYEN